MKFRIPLFLLALAFSLALSACGLNVGAAKPTPTPDPQKAMLAFAQCMRQHGIDMPDPVFSSSGGGAMVKQELGNGIDPTSAQFQAAQKACQSLLPNRPDSGTMRTQSGGGSGAGLSGGAK